MPTNLTFLFIVILCSCYSIPEIDGFDSEKWKASDVCSDYRIQAAELLEANEQKIQGLIQKEIQELLGVNRRHELDKRNEQFFYYPITVDCGDSIPNTSLSFRFDALGRVKEVQLILE